MSEKRQPSVGGTEELIPTKDALTSLKSDVTHVTAIEELIDNAIDNALREHSLTYPLTVEVFAEHHDDEDRTELVVRDDAGGVQRKNANIIFTLGDSGDATDEPLIGAYGLGAKKALMNLGLPFTIASRHEDAEIGWEYTIDEDWFNDETDWEVEVTPNDELEAGVTEIRVHDLDYNWFGIDEDDEDAASTPERLREEFGSTYNLFLGEFGVHDYDVTIEVQGDPVEPLGGPDYAFTPVDDMYPRKFKNITIDLDGYATTELTVTVGFLREGDNEAAGVDVYIQGRQVLYAARDERVGFGDELSTFDPRHDTRFKLVIEMETTGDAQTLPWDTQKSNIDPFNVIMAKANWWTGRAAADYHDLDDNKVEAGFVSPYSPTHPEAANEGDIVEHDFRDREKITGPFRPGTSQDDVTEINRLVKAHAKMRFKCERAIDDDDYIPAYRQRLDDVLGSEQSYSTLRKLDTDPVDFNENNAQAIADDIETVARRHVNEGVIYSGDLPFWQEPKYKAAIGEIRESRSIPRKDLKELDDPPEGLPTTIDDVGDDDEEDTSETSSESPESAGEDDDQVAEVALRFIDSSGGGREAVLYQGPREELVSDLGLGDGATDEELAEKLDRRFGVLMEL
jgi:hypothetical protein